MEVSGQSRPGRFTPGTHSGGSQSQSGLRLIWNLKISKTTLHPVRQVFEINLLKPSGNFTYDQV
jgi:hypothetical protein